MSAAARAFIAAHVHERDTLEATLDAFLAEQTAMLRAALEDPRLTPASDPTAEHTLRGHKMETCQHDRCKLYTKYDAAVAFVEKARALLAAPEGRP